MKRLLALMAVLVLVFGFGVMANAAIINFDGIADGTVVNNLYSGVTFTDLFSGVDGGDVYARVSGTNNSPGNVVSVFETGFPLFNNRYGTIHAAFATAQTSVSIDAYLLAGAEGFGSTGTGFMNVYNSSDVLLATITTSTLGSWQTLSYAGSDITNVYFSVSDPNFPTYAFFDNFTFGENGGGDPGPGPGSDPVPEPGTMLLLGSGLVGLVGYGRRHLKK